MATDQICIQVDESNKADEKPSAERFSSDSRRQALDDDEVMAANEIRIQIEEKLYGESRSIAWPPTSSTPSNSNTHIQPQAPGNNCNHIYDHQTKNLEEDLVQLSRTTSDTDSWCIFKVPFRIRQVNEKAYEPKLISIGPYHHGEEHLKKMEIIKKKCLGRIIGDSMDRAKELVKVMKDMEEDVRKCYPEALYHIDSDAFVKMMILDGCFIVNLFQNDNSLSLLEQNGVLSTCELYCDLLLLENQLPYSVLSKLYSMINMSNAEMDEVARLAQMEKFVRLPLSYFSEWISGPLVFPKKFPESIKHLSGLVHDSWIPQYTTDQGHGTFSNFIRCARELEAGIKFVKKENKVGEDQNEKDEEGVASLLFDIEFTDDAKLKIPTLHIDENTELILRNFMAYEQFIPRREPTYVCDYVVFMDNLIDSGKDAQLLRHSGVIVNWLGDDETVAQMFNRLRDFTFISGESFYYSKIYDEVNEHFHKKWNVWKAKLRTDYFNSPWSLISVIAAVVLLLLTLSQTIFSVLSYVHPK